MPSIGFTNEQLLAQERNDRALAEKLQDHEDSKAYRERRPRRSDEATRPWHATELGLTGHAVPLSLVRDGYATSWCHTCEGKGCTNRCTVTHTMNGQLRATNG